MADKAIADCIGIGGGGSANKRIARSAPYKETGRGVLKAGRCHINRDRHIVRRAIPRCIRRNNSHTVRAIGYRGIGVNSDQTVTVDHKQSSIMADKAIADSMVILRSHCTDQETAGIIRR